jgi:sugar/nucleoside kinase (ribokinase family)
MRYQASPCCYTLQIGTDANAAVLKDALVSYGVDLSHLRDVEGSTGTAVILLQPSGEQGQLWQEHRDCMLQ